MTCNSNTVQGRRCKNKPSRINVTKRGVVTVYCNRHWFWFYGRHGALPDGLTVIKYTASRYAQLTNSVDPADDAWRYGILDSWAYLKGR